jgi:chemotaxis signal transduction protein
MEANTPQARLRQLLPQLFESTTRSGDRYLKCLMTPDRPGLIPLQTVQEALILPIALVTPIPNLSPSVLGWMSSRSQVLCVVDLPHLLQLSSSLGHRQFYPIIIVRSAQAQGAVGEESLLGLAVHQIQGIERLTADQIQKPSSSMTENLLPFIQGMVVQDKTQIPILDIQIITKAPALTHFVAIAEGGSKAFAV